MSLHENIRSADPRTRGAHSYSAPAQPAAEDEVAQFIAALVRLIKPERVLELGTAFGHTAEVIGKALVDNGLGHLDTVERNQSRLPAARARLADLPATVHHKDYAKWTPPGRYDLVFFDSDRHNRDREYQMMEPYINDYAVLLFHDAGEQHQGDSGGSIARLPLPTVYLPCPRGLVIAGQPERKGKS